MVTLLVFIYFVLFCSKFIKMEWNLINNIYLLYVILSFDLEKLFKFCNLKKSKYLSFINVFDFK